MSFSRLQYVYIQKIQYKTAQDKGYAALGKRAIKDKRSAISEYILHIITRGKVGSPWRMQAKESI